MGSTVAPIVTASTRLLVLTGAGISAESGLRTYRGPGGLWEGRPAELVATPEAFAADPGLVLRFFTARRAAALQAEPNAAHDALANVEERLGDRFLLVTQNVDGLHARAGSQRLLEIHGSLFRSRCASCDLAPFDDDRVEVPDPLPVCPACAARGVTSLLRPAVVWFGEELDQGQLDRIDAFIDDAARSGDPFAFLAIGTSGLVYPAAGIVEQAAAVGAGTWLVNVELPVNASRFDHVEIGRATDLVPALLAADPA